VLDADFLRVVRLRIRKARLKKRLSQEEAAELLGLPLRTYQILEVEHAKRTNPSLETIMNISEKLEIPVGKLLAVPSSKELMMDFPTGKRPRKSKGI
jgi:transcriptional regulator with XRE-family HTH domain